MLQNQITTEFNSNLEGKVIVADTSSLLTSGVALLSSLPSCHLVIPSIVVKELEDKRTHATLGFLAREWLRLLESLRQQDGKMLAKKVVVPGRRDISLQVEPNHSSQTVLPQHLRDGSNDSTILSVAVSLQEELKETTKESVVILSNDTPMRLHATIDLQLEAVEYNSTLATGAKPFDGRRKIELSMEEYLASEEVLRTHGKKLSTLIEKALKDAVVESHSFVEITIPDATKPIKEYVYHNGFLSPLLHKQKASGIVTRAVEQDVAMMYLSISPEELPIVSISGGAGTGKTLLSCAVGLEELQAGNFQKMIVFRSLHEMGRGQELGFLPGDVDEKMEAWAGAIYDSLDVIAYQSLKNPSKGDRRSDEKKAESLKAEVKRLRELIEVSPITYLRGRSLSNSYVILDEAQNFSRNELLNIISRVGEGTKIVLCSDSTQVDNKFLQIGAKADIWSVINDLKREDLFAHITLNKTERSRVAEISSKLLSL